MSKAVRRIKEVTKGYSSTQVKVRDATSNDPWGPTGTQMSEIAQMTFNGSNEFYEIMDMIDKRLNDKGKNWRHVLKALKVLDYCLHEGSELVVTWAKQGIYIIKTLREFQYIDEDGRDVGQNVRVAAKEITSLILDDERLTAERSDRKTWKSRVTGLDEFAPQQSDHSPRRPRERRATATEDDDAEYKLALEASKYQEEEDRKKREGRGGGGTDDDLAKAIQLSQEEEERRRRELEEQNANLLFDDTPSQPANQVQNTGYNQGYQQGNPVDFFANPIEQNQMASQPTGFINQGYTGFPSQPTGMPNYATYNMPAGMGAGQFGQQNGPNMAGIQGQPGPNPYAQPIPQQQPQQNEPAPQPGSNNPWATNQNQQQQAVAPMPTGSNNPFAQHNRPQAGVRPGMSSLTSLPEQKTLSSFNNMPSAMPQPQSQPSFGQPQQSPSPAQQPPVNDYQTKLNSLLASGDGMDTFGNTGELRIPAQHTAPGMFANSAGSGVQRLANDATGNPYMRQQFTGMPSVSYGGQTNGQGSNNPFGARPAQQQGGQNQDLIQF